MDIQYTFNVKWYWWLHATFQKIIIPVILIKSYFKKSRNFRKKILNQCHPLISNYSNLKSTHGSSNRRPAVSQAARRWTGSKCRRRRSAATWKPIPNPKTRMYLGWQRRQVFGTIDPRRHPCFLQNINETIRAIFQRYLIYRVACMPYLPRDSVGWRVITEEVVRMGGRGNSSSVSASEKGISWGLYLVLSSFIEWSIFILD